MTTGTELVGERQPDGRIVAVRSVAPPADPQLPGLGAVEEWLAAAGKARQLAELLVRGAFVPQSYKPTAGAPEDAWETAVQNATGAILLAQQLGVDPITGLQQIVMVKGRPTMYAKFKIGLLVAHGHEVWEEERSEKRSTWCGRRAGWPEDRVVRVTITIEQAKTAGWTSNDTYTKTPEDMLGWRAASRVCDRVAPEVLFGLPSFADELDPGDNGEPARTPVGVTVVDGVPPTAGNAGRSLTALVQKASAEREARASIALDRDQTHTFPPVAEEPARVPQVVREGEDVSRATGGVTVTQTDLPPAPPAEGPSGVTRPQLSQISMLLGGRHALGGPGSVAKRGRILSALAGRPLKTTQELTANEAVTVIAHLENTDTKALLAMADPTVGPEQEPDGPGSDPWDEPDRDAQTAEQ